MILACSALSSVGSLHAAQFIQPSLTTAVLADDNIFISAEDPQSDVIFRVSPSVEVGHESRTFSASLYYGRDIENYSNNSDLNSSNMRQVMDASVAYQPSAVTVYSMGANYLESRIPAEFNITTGVGEGRVDGDRLLLYQEVNHRFSTTLKGVAGYTFRQENLAGGVRSDSNALSLGLEQTRSPVVQISYDYDLIHYQFDDGISETVHTPRTGVFYSFGPNTSLSGQVGPRFSREGVGVDAAAMLQHRYPRGGFQVGYDRSAATLIGERGLVELNAFNASMYFNVSDRLEASLIGNYGAVSRRGTTLNDADVYRAMMSLNYRVNANIGLVGSYAYSRQNVTALDGQIVIPGNVVMLAMTFTTSPRAERVSRDL